MFDTSSTWWEVIASVGMAVGPSLVYADQAYSILRKKDATGFSRDVCAILLISNIARCFFWIGDRFETPLLVQSLLLIVTQLALLFICVTYRPPQKVDSYGLSTRPLSFWQWTAYAQYIEFLAAYILCMTILFLIFGRMQWFITALGYFALGIESTLPIPQLISNFKHKSLYGFRATTLLGWFGGDTFKTGYFFYRNSPIQFRVGAVFQLSVDCAIVVQRFVYGNAPPVALVEEDDIEQALALAEE